MRPREHVSTRSIISRKSAFFSCLVIAALIMTAAGYIPGGQYTPPEGWSGEVVLAELFTGSECPPCVAADMAFDELLEHYPRSVLAVLEYHQHVPLPDPMTNPHTIERAGYYGIRGTPSVYIGGKAVGGGGGSARLAQARFDTYSREIEKQLTLKPAVDIELEGRRSGPGVSVSATVKSTGELEGAGSLRLHIALVEKDLAYTGINGIENHRMVVRHMIGGPDGYPIAFGDNGFTASADLDLDELRAGLLAYLNDTEKRWRQPGRWTGYARKMDFINPDNLMLVAFVQEDRRGRVLQAKVVELN